MTKGQIPQITKVADALEQTVFDFIKLQLIAACTLDEEGYFEMEFKRSISDSQIDDEVSITGIEVHEGRDVIFIVDEYGLYKEYPLEGEKISLYLNSAFLKSVLTEILR